MNREQLMHRYNTLTLITKDTAEWLICCIIYTELRKGVRGSVKRAKIHLRARRYDIARGRLAA